MSFITSADAVFIITVKGLFNAPITLENWASDRAWETEDQELLETRMSVDGKLNMGFVPNPIDQRLVFSANSPSLIIFDTLATAMKQARQPYKINGELTLKGLGRKFTFTAGGLVGYKPTPSGGRILEDRPVHIRWEEVLPAGI